MAWGQQIPPPGTPLNKGLDFVRSLAGIWPFNERAGLTAAELVGVPDARLTAAVGAASGGYSFATGGKFEAPSSPRYDGTYGSLAFWMKTTQLTNFVLLMARADSNSRNGITIFLDSSTGAVRVQLYAASALVMDISGTTYMRDGKKRHVAVAWDRSVNGQCFVYVDGKLEASGVNTGAWSFNSQVIRGALALDTFWTQNTGSLDMPLWLNRIIQPGEVKQLAVDPYFMFYKVRRRTYGIPAAATGGNPRLVNGGLVNTGLVGGRLIAA